MGLQTVKAIESLRERKDFLYHLLNDVKALEVMVREDLFEKGIQGPATETILAELEASGFVDEERFVRSYARGKFRIKRWGKGRISQELKLRQISSALIQLGLSEIDGEEYFATLEREAEKKWEKTKEKDAYKKKYLVTHYLMSKGFEQDLIQEALSALISNEKG